MRIYTLALSVIAHLLAVGFVVVVPLVATNALPAPHRLVEFVHVRPAIPPPPRSREENTRETAPSDAAPVDEPRNIEPEPDPMQPESFEGLPSVVHGTWVDHDSFDRDSVPPPPAPTPERAPVRVGGAVTRPERVHDVPPLYPAVARTARIEGTVILEAVIGTDGTVRDVRVLRSVPLLDNAAIDTVRQWLFTPTRLNGEPVPVVMTVTVTFSLR